MNYVILFIEVLLVFFLLLLLYKMTKKDGLFFVLSLFSSVLCIMFFKVINIFDFDVNMGIPFIVGIFIVTCVIVHRYGMDEIKRIVSTFSFSYILSYIILMITTLTISSDLIGNNNYNILFGYDLYNVRYFISGLLSIGMVIVMGSNVYDSVRKSKNSIIFNSVGALLIVLFVESIIFVCAAHIGKYSIVELFGMIVIRYLISVMIGLLGTIPTYLLVKRNDK